MYKLNLIILILFCSQFLFAANDSTLSIEPEILDCNILFSNSPAITPDLKVIILGLQDGSIDFIPNVDPINKRIFNPKARDIALSLKTATDQYNLTNADQYSLAKSMAYLYFMNFDPGNPSHLVHHLGRVNDENRLAHKPKPGLYVQAMNFAIRREKELHLAGFIAKPRLTHLIADTMAATFELSPQDITPYHRKKFLKLSSISVWNLKRIRKISESQYFRGDINRLRLQYRQGESFYLDQVLGEAELLEFLFETIHEGDKSAFFDDILFVIQRHREQIARISEKLQQMASDQLDSDDPRFLRVKKKLDSKESQLKMTLYQLGDLIKKGLFSMEELTSYQID